MLINVTSLKVLMIKVRHIKHMLINVTSFKGPWIKVKHSKVRIDIRTIPAMVGVGLSFSVKYPVGTDICTYAVSTGR